MGAGIAIICGMTVVSVGTMFAGKLLEGAGRISDAQMVDLTSKGMLAITALGTFGKVIQALLKLG